MESFGGEGAVFSLLARYWRAPGVKIRFSFVSSPRLASFLAALTPFGDQRSTGEPGWIMTYSAAGPRGFCFETRWAM